MVTLSHLFISKEPVEGWDQTKDAISGSIDDALERGTCDKDVLHIMKELLNGLNTPSMSDYVEEVKKDG